MWHIMKSRASAARAEKGNYPHFLIKEIYEQPEVVNHTPNHYVDQDFGRIKLPVQLPFNFAAVSKLSILACGTSYYAALHRSSMLSRCS